MYPHIDQNPSPVVTIIRLFAGYTANGNARDIFVLINENNGISATYDASQKGRGAVPKEFSHLQPLEIATTPKAYREFLKLEVC